jgi:FAD/FMN-containing dehydrogenase
MVMARWPALPRGMYQDIGTGEHGVGLLKRDGMRRELGPGALVRQALDPLGLFNPGKG